MCCRARWVVPGLILLALVTAWPAIGRPARVFFRAQDWLGTSPETQLRMVNGTVRAWEEVAETAETRGPMVERLSVREREAFRMLECIRVHPGLTPEEVRQAIQVYAGQHPDGIFSTFGDLAALALDRRCRASEAK